MNQLVLDTTGTPVTLPESQKGGYIAELNAFRRCGDGHRQDCKRTARECMGFALPIWIFHGSNEELRAFRMRKRERTGHYMFVPSPAL